MLQKFFNDGLVTIIGSGLSCAEGLPSMSELAAALISELSKRCPSDDFSTWKIIEEKILYGVSLEEAACCVPVSETLENLIVSIVANFVQNAELATIKLCLETERNLKLTYLLPHLSVQHPKFARIITTNYDRLIEVAAESQNFWVDTGFCGRFIGCFAPDKSKYQGSVGRRAYGRQNINPIFPPRVQLFKPHGSLDWTLRQGIPIHSPFLVGELPLIITPGTSKYLKGYQQPFDTHIASGNKAIDAASALLFIGYGFNDDHLQTHIISRLKTGIPGLILVRSLTDSAKKLISETPSLIALSSAGNNNTLVTTSVQEWTVDNLELWDIEQFVIGVLAP